jgi:hypothetical protein
MNPRDGRCGEAILFQKISLNYFFLFVILPRREEKKNSGAPPWEAK